MSYGRKVAPWKWGNGNMQKRSYGQTNVSDSTPKSARQGIRPLGRTDISDIPVDLNLRNIMKLPWVCPHCRNTLLHRPAACGRCGQVTPVGQWLKDYGRR